MLTLKHMAAPKREGNLGPFLKSGHVSASYTTDVE
jgi:hypothetical protein